MERPLRMGSYLRLSGFFPQVSSRTSFCKELGAKVGIVTLRVIVGMRKGSIKRQNSSGNCLTGIDIPSSSCVEGPSVLSCDVTSQKKPDVRLWAITPVTCFKNLISENSELQPRLDEEIGPGRLSEFF